MVTPSAETVPDEEQDGSDVDARDDAPAGPTARGLRERARRDITAAMKRHAEEQIAVSGPAALSLRAISRALGMAPSAVYRYFASRDELIEALITDAFHELGDAAQTALSRSLGETPVLRWITVCRAVRSWALAHPHRYDLLYGAPVPGHRSGAETTRAAARVGLVLVAVIADAARRDLLDPAPPPAPAAVQADAVRLVDSVGLAIPPARVPALLAAWSGLFGLVSFELFGQLDGMVTARAEFFDQSVRVLAQNVGIRG